MRTVLQDLRFGLRQLRRNPGFAAVALLTLALCIGANTAMFTVVNVVLLHDLPFPDPDRLVRAWEFNRRDGQRRNVGPDTFGKWMERQQSFSHIAAYHFGNFVLAGGEGAERVLGIQASSEFFDALGVLPLRGRGFSAGDVILSHTFWQRRFDGDPNIIGRAVAINGAAATIAGVMPEDFAFPNSRIDVWLPLDVVAAAAKSRLRYLSVVARLKTGATFDQAKADLDTITRSLDPRSDMGATVLPLKEQVVGASRLTILTFFGAVVAVLLIGCANVASLLYARATARDREFGIRFSLGARRGRVIRQLITECLVLSGLAGLAALAVSGWTVDLFVALSPDLPRTREISPDVWVFAFAAIISLLSAAAFGIAPALRVSRPAAGPPRRKATGAFVIASEAALAMMLLITAGLLMRSYLGLRAIDPGFRTEDLVVFHLSVPASSPAGRSEPPPVFRNVLQRLEVLPGVIAAGATDELPFGFTRTTRSFEIEGRRSDPDKLVIADICSASPDYFTAMGIPLRLGRSFTEQDRGGAARVAVVNELMARRFWPGESPVGERVILGAPSEVYEVVGVVGNVRHGLLREEFAPEIYLSWNQNPLIGTAAVLSPNRDMGFAVRAETEPAILIPAIRAAIRDVSGDVAIYAIRPVRQVVAETIATDRSQTFLLGIFAAIAMVLAGVGTYGVLSHAVEQRRREIGIRMALGAQAADVTAMVVKSGIGPAIAGLMAGAAGALAVTRIVARFLYGVSPSDPASYAAAAALLACVALLASYIPARRATRVDPMVALRYE